MAQTVISRVTPFIQPSTALPSCISAPGTAADSGVNPLSAVQKAMVHWRAVRGLGASQNIVVHHIGDSIGVGSVASDWKLSYAELVRAWMITTLGIPLAADFINPMYSVDFASGGPPGTPPWFIGGGDAGLTGWGYQYLPANAVTNFARTTSADGHATASSTACTSASAAFKQGDVGGTISIPGAGASGATLSTTIASVQSATACTLAVAASTTVTTAAITITPLFTCKFDSSLMPSPNCINLDAHLLNRGGTCHLALDGVDQGLVTNANDNTWTIVPFSGLSNTAHTLSMITQSGVETGLLGGVTIYPGARNATGLQWARFAGAGRSANNWSNTGGRPQNQFTNLTGAAYHAGSSGFPGVGCDLLLLGMGINDMQQASASPPATADIQNTIAGFDAICSAERGANPNCSIVLIIHNSEDPTYGQVTSANWTHAVDWRRYYKPAFYQVAQAYNAVVVDVDALWLNAGVTYGVVTASQPHPNTTGHSATAPYGIAYLLQQLLAA